MIISKISTAVNPSQPQGHNGVSGVDTSMPNPYKVLINGGTDAYKASTTWATTSFADSAMITAWGLSSEGEEAHVKIFRIVRSAGSITTSTINCETSYVAGTAAALLYKEELCNVKLTACNPTVVLPIFGEYVVEFVIDEEGNEPVYTHGVTVTWLPIPAVRVPDSYIAGGA